MARLLREQGYAATGRAQLLAESGISNGSLYHHFPGGMEALAAAALEASGHAVADALWGALSEAPSTGVGICRFLDVAAGPQDEESCPGCPIAPAALESPILSPVLRETAARCFDQWKGLIATRLEEDGWAEDTREETASAVLAVVEGALLLARVSGQRDPLTHAKKAVLRLLG